MRKFFVKSISVIVLAGLLVLRAPMVSAATEAELLAASDAATAYLGGQQQPDGSIAGYGGETDWTVIAVVANGQKPEEIVSGEGNSLVDALESNPLDATASATDVERRILAIAAAGKDTKDFGDVNYNELLSAQHIDEQIGDTTLLNDDWFGIMAIEAVGDDDLREVAEDSLNFVLENQKENGGFSYTTVDCGKYCTENSNDTSAAIIAFGAAENMGINNAKLETGKEKAVVYLLTTRNDDGGFGNTPENNSDAGSTSWGLMALNTLGDTYRDYISAAQQWLLNRQNADGGFGYFEGSSDTFTTPGVVTALLGTNWLLTPKSIKQVTPETPVVAPTATPVAANTMAEPQATAVVAAATSETPAAATLAAEAPVEPAQQASTTARRYIAPVVLAAAAAQADEPQISSTSTTTTTEAKTNAEQVLGDSSSKSNNVFGFVLIGLAVAGFAAYALRSRFASRTK